MNIHFYTTMIIILSYCFVTFHKHKYMKHLWYKKDIFNIVVLLAVSVRLHGDLYTCLMYNLAFRTLARQL